MFKTIFQASIFMNKHTQALLLCWKFHKVILCVCVCVYVSLWVWTSEPQECFRMTGQVTRNHEGWSQTTCYYRIDGRINVWVYFRSRAELTGSCLGPSWAGLLWPCQRSCSTAWHSGSTALTPPQTARDKKNESLRDRLSVLLSKRCPLSSPLIILQGLSKHVLGCTKYH